MVYIFYTNYGYLPTNKDDFEDEGSNSSLSFNEQLGLINARKAADKELKMLDMQAAEAQRQEAEAQRREAEAQRRHELLLLEKQAAISQANVSNTQTSPKTSITPSFDVTKHLKMVPPFNEDNLEVFFETFSKIAKRLEWPEKQHIVLLQSVLKGKAQEVFAAMPYDESQKFDNVKNAILKAYELVPEGYRQKFRNCRKSDEQTFYEYAQEKEMLFDRWCLSKSVNKNFENLKQFSLKILKEMLYLN